MTEPSLPRKTEFGEAAGIARNIDAAWLRVVAAISHARVQSPERANVSLQHSREWT